MVGEQPYKNRDKAGSDSGLGHLLVTITKRTANNNKDLYFGGPCTTSKQWSITKQTIRMFKSFVQAILYCFCVAHTFVKELGLGIFWWLVEVRSRIGLFGWNWFQGFRQDSIISKESCQICSTFFRYAIFQWFVDR